AVAAVGLGRAGPREQAAAGDRRGQAHACHGPTHGPSHHAGPGPRLRSAVSHRWLSGVSDGLADALWVLGAVGAPAGPRPCAETALDAAAPAALCAGDQDR